MLIFKIVPRAEWDAAGDMYEGSAHDRADGFLHFSTGPQLAETLRRYYADQDGLVLVAVDASALARRCAGNMRRPAARTFRIFMARCRAGPCAGRARWRGAPTASSTCPG
jgi:uncharacterized protein (DUF952 family)